MLTPFEPAEALTTVEAISAFLAEAEITADPAYIEHAHGRADLLADGFDQVTVDTVMRLVDRAEWKRRQYPLGPKVTALAFGRDRRLPVTNAFRE